MYEILLIAHEAAYKHANDCFVRNLPTKNRSLSALLEILQFLEERHAHFVLRLWN